MLRHSLPKSLLTLSASCFAMMATLGLAVQQAQAQGQPAKAQAKAVAPAGTASPVWEAESHRTPWTHTLNLTAGKRVDMAVKLADKGRPWQFFITTKDQPDTHWLRLYIGKDKEGSNLSARTYLWQEGKWQLDRRDNLRFWPTARATKDIANLKEDGITQRSWYGKTIPMRWQVIDGKLTVWMQGQIICAIDAPDKPFDLKLTADAGDTLVSMTEAKAQGDWRYLTVDLSTEANAKAPSHVLADAKSGKNPVPYELVNQGKRMLDLVNADWIDGKRNPQSYYSRYDSGQYFLGDDRQPMIQIPQADYTAAYVLAQTSSDKKLSNILALRVGRYNTSSRGQVLRYDFITDMPRSSDTAAMKTVRVDMSRAFSQDILDGVMDVEITKQIELARHSSDPNRFRWRPEGLASGVRIAAITFERSPLQIKVKGSENGNMFVQTQTPPSFNISLTNISPTNQAFTLDATATYVEGQTTLASTKGSVQPGQTQDVTLNIPAKTRGYYNLSIQLKDVAGKLLLERKTTFAILPNVQRPYHDESPVGVWDFCGGHLTPNDPDFTGPIYQKLGIRYGMFSYPVEARQKYGVIKGNEFAIRLRTDTSKTIELYKAMREKAPDLLPNLLLFHEDSISGPQVTRPPDLFTDRPPYKLNEKEQKRFKEMWDKAVEAATAMRAYDPKVNIALGNGPVPLREEFYRHNFPAELFDSAGNEAGVFGRPPEAQPPDIVANNASIWMDRQLLDHYGYTDKTIRQCYEIDYPNTNPGNLSHATQAAYFARHILHGMAWKIPQIRVGSITDMGNSYYFSNWGASGIMNRWPEVNPKPSAVALGTLTWVMDGATYQKTLDLTSDSLYGLLFNRKDGKHVIALWAIRGQRPVTLTFPNAPGITRVNSQGVETTEKLNHNSLTVAVSGTPVYLVIDGNPAISKVSLSQPQYTSAPKGKVTELDALTSLKNWKVSGERNPMLEAYNPFEPRRLGDFKFQAVKNFEGKKQVIKVTPEPLKTGKATMPMYAQLLANKAISLPGQPTELGVFVNGNGGWGRIIFQFQDAKGQNWTSVGAPANSGNSWLADWMPAEMLKDYNPEQNADWNTNDVYGASRISFDGWRYVGVDLPGQFPGTPYPWPANSQWHYDQDGIVHYPIKLTGMVVQMSEKTLHLMDFEPARRPSIYLSKLIVAQNGTPPAKTNVQEYQDNAQVNGLD